VTEPVLVEGDLLAGDAKARAALARVSLREVASADEPAFEDAYGALLTEFGPRGELERREVVVGWMRGRAPGAGPAHLDGISWRYHLLIAQGPQGALAGVRDCHVTVDPASRVGVVYLAHTWVSPEHRRTGVASLLRLAPITLGRRAMTETGAAPGDLLLAAEMEPADSDAPASVVRLVAYGKAGFAAIDPRSLPYCQPDFGDLSSPGSSPRPLPLLAVVRWIDHEGSPALPRALAERVVRHLYAVFATHCRAEHLSRPRDHALASLAAAPPSIPLLPLPRDPDDQAALAPLTLANVLPHHLPELRSPGTPHPAENRCPS
jgi:hypothetical protein